jgi:hypothetical protein
VVLTLLILCAVKGGSQEASLGDKVVAFCKTHKGEQVGSGECVDLAFAALRAAGARTRGKGPANPGEYAWGDLVLVLEGTRTGAPTAKGKFEGLHAGDIIQFRNVKLEGHGPGGMGRYVVFFGQHTAVVASFDRKNKLLRVFHQNVNGKRFVLEGAFRPDDLNEGTIRIYRPVPK